MCGYAISRTPRCSNRQPIDCVVLLDAIQAAISGLIWGMAAALAREWRLTRRARLLADFTRALRFLE
jgi:hypothetical protein